MATHATGAVLGHSHNHAEAAAALVANRLSAAAFAVEGSLASDVSNRCRTRIAVGAVLRRKRKRGAKMC